MKAIDTAQAFADGLTSELGPSVNSVTLFGSAARGEHVQPISDINVLVLLENIDADTLGAMARVVRDYRKARLNPLPMELGHWRRAADVFAIEVSDMADARFVLAGIDPIEGAEIQRAALRVQAERELRAKLIALHTGLLHAADDKGAVGAVLVAALPAFATYLRAALRIAGEPVPGAMREVIEAGCARAGADPQGLLGALEARVSGGGLTLALGDPAVTAYNEAAERLTEFVDRFQLVEDPT